MKQHQNEDDYVKSISAHAHENEDPLTGFTVIKTKQHK